MHTAGACAASSQSAISRTSSGGFEMMDRNGESRRFHKPGSSTTTNVRCDEIHGVVANTARPPAPSAHRLMSCRELKIAGGPSSRRCGSHFAQSHCASRSGSVNTTTSRSAGPCRVVASTTRVRASAERNRSDPVTATARSEPRSALTTDAPDPSTRTPIGRANASGWPGRRSHSVGAASMASRTASTTGRRSGAERPRGGRLNATVPSASGMDTDLAGSERAGLSSWNAREPIVTVPWRHGVEDEIGVPSSVISVPSEMTVTSDAAFVGSTTSSNAVRSTGAMSSSSAFDRRPGPIRYLPGPSRVTRPAPWPAIWTRSTSALDVA